MNTTPIGWGIGIAGVAIAVAIYFYSENNRYHGFPAKFSDMDMVIIVDGKTGTRTATVPVDKVTK